MGYAETLGKMVENSGLTLKEIADKCKENGVKIDPSYISKLQKGKQAPASDEVNIALAKACNGDQEILIYEAFIEKAPEFIREFVKKLLEYFRSVSKAMVVPQVPETMQSALEKKIDEATDIELIKVFLEEDGIFPPEQQNEFFIMKDHEDKDVKMMVNQFMGLKMPDDSMEPIIEKGVQLQLDSPSSVKSGDIVVATLGDQSFVVRRYVPVNDQVILIAENSKFAPLNFLHSQVMLAGKVKSYIKEL